MTRPVGGPYYPLGDRVPDVDLRAQRDYMAEATGEFRAILPGEWYVSGAIPAAYRFPGATGTPTRTAYHVARLVRVRRYEVIEPMT